MSEILGFNGKPRSGKTLALALLALMAMKAGRRVYANFYIAGAEYITPYDLLRFLELGAENETNSPLFDADIYCQEFQTWIESRLGQAKATLAITDFICQAPKLGFRLRYDTQLNSAVDKRLKQNASARFEAERRPNGFRYWELDVEKTEENVRTGRKKFIPYDFARTFVFPFYNTRKVSLRPGFGALMEEVKGQDPGLKLATIERQVDLLEKNRGLLLNFTRPAVEYALLRLGQSCAFASYVAVGLQLRRKRTP